MALLARLVGSLLLAAGTASGGFVKAGHWNLYWRALGNPDGRKAIVESLDEAASGGPFDFLSLVEASGSAPGGFPAWLEESKALRSGGGMARLSGQSGHETIALLYRATEWDEKYSHVGDMGTGRPYLLALFRNRASPLVWTWVLSIHTPHWPQVGSYRPGDTLVEALRNASKYTTHGIDEHPLLLMGDFNEFGECSLPPDVKCSNEWYRPAASGIAPLWDFLGAAKGAVGAAIPFNTTTCCTKWEEGLSDWQHHFDKIFYSPRYWHVQKQPEFLKYTYPGISGSCTTPACTGDSPPGGKAPTAQGSWHRGWQVTFGFRNPPPTSSVAEAYV